jgi:hypothetical protein
MTLSEEAVTMVVAKPGSCFLGGNNLQAQRALSGEAAGVVAVEVAG